nr:MAG TPA: hypothetical protein [Inoviridae sp.]
MSWFLEFKPFVSSCYSSNFFQGLWSLRLVVIICFAYFILFLFVYWGHFIVISILGIVQ